MKTKLLCVLLLLSPLLAPAQGSDLRFSRGDTHLVLPVGVASFTPSTLASRVRVPPYEYVRIVVPESIGEPIQWLKNNQPIADATGRALEIPLATSSDSGVYSIGGLSWPYYAPGIQLEVVPSGNIGNYSSRIELQQGGSPQIVGFVVTGTTTKLMLYRAVGPTLSNFGVSKPAPQPRVRAYDSAGNPYGTPRPAVVYDFAAWFKTLGAFPLTGGEGPASMEFEWFKPGAYTIHVWDESGAAGTVLLEIYEADSPPPPLGHAGSTASASAGT